jgi:hypothetical protein
MVLPLVIAGISAALGIGAQIIGGSQQSEAASKQAALAKKQAQQQKKAAAKQNEIIKQKIIPLLKEQGKLEEKASDASARAEALRAKQMELDATRTQRQVVRNAIMARAQSTSAAANQGALASTGFFGSLSQITSESNRQLGGIFQNLSIGRGIFEENAAMAEFLTDAAKARTKVNVRQAKLGTISNSSAATSSQYNAKIQAAGVNNGAMWSNIGSTLVSSAGTIASLGTSALFGNTTSSPTPSTQPGSTFSNGYFYDQPVR